MAEKLEILMEEDPSVGGNPRKRSRDDVMKAEDAPTVNNLSLDDSSNKPEECPSIKSLSLEAIFHPKFENESQTDQSIRSQMKQRVEEGKGYVEVSLKHSGSLLLWSGGQRYYSKNATENPFTYVGEVLLRQHFFRAFAHEESDSDTLEQHYQTCSDYVQEHRLTLAFEVVTAILGHHGDIPIKDFLILTAVADRNTERFYSSTELVEFAQRFRLPHNDTWVFISMSSVDGLFHLYDTTRETGLAEDTVAALNSVADMHVSSMYPHTVFQGNILEGIVIRYVPYHDQNKEETIMQGLATESERILQAVPPETPPSFVLAKNLSKNVTTTIPPVLSKDIRELTQNTMATGDRDQVSAFLQTSIYDILCSSDGNRRRSVDRSGSSKPWTTDFGATLRQELSKQEKLDKETERILKLIETLDSLNAKVNYRIVKESNGGKQPDRLLCIVHVLFDTTHQKFRRKMEPNDMNLFRGFCIELGSESKVDAMQIESSSGDTSMPLQTDDSSDGLMLKMKFLPYMVRTFGCRNGLDVVRKRGPQAFTEYAMKLMAKWGMSNEAKAKWQPFFSAWGKYAHLCLTEEEHEYKDPSLSKLCDSYYLDHLKHFTFLYESGKIVGGGDEQSTSTFRGIIFVVALDQEMADAAAEEVSARLGGLVVRKGLQKLAQEDWESACLARQIGIVCTIIVGQDKPSNVRKRMQDYGEASFGLLVGCDEAAIMAHCEKNGLLSREEDEGKSESQTDNDNAEGTPAKSGKKSKKKGNKKKSPDKELKGVAMAWRKTRFAVDARDISNDEFLLSTTEKDNDEAAPLDDELSKILAEFEKRSADLSKPDERPGILAFFVGIPGSGKSTLCSKDVEDKLRISIKNLEESEMSDGDDPSTFPRPVIVRVSDEAKQKYWPLVKVERTKYPSSLYIADKNAPPAGWPKVAEMCAIKDGTAVAVLPDEASLQTTTVNGAGVYPFSLHYLAVCMERVLSRPPESHAGKLDSSTDIACMVVVKFYSLYRGISHDELLPSISRAIERGGARMSSEPVTVPFFAQRNLPNLPSDLEDALVDAIRIQYEHDVIHNETMSIQDEQVAEIETRLRSVLEKHRSFLLSLAADPKVSKESFASQLLERASALPDSADLLDGEPTAADAVKIASVDVKQASIHSLLVDIAKTSPVVTEVLKKCSEPSNDTNETANVSTNDDGVLVGENFVADTHVTMAHCSQVSQNMLREAFEPLIGCKVNVRVTGILWNDDSVALAVKVDSSTQDEKSVPAPKNVFPHITLWYKPGVSAAFSNELPALVEAGKAQRVDFEEPVVLEGVVSLWGEDRC